MATATLSPAPASSLDPAFVSAFLKGTVTHDQVAAALPRDRSAIIFLLMQLSTAVVHGASAPASGPHTPSGAVPPYHKPKTNGRRKKRGAQPGHPGHSRPRPTEVDHHHTHELTACPNCGGDLDDTGKTRTRTTEDVPDGLRSEVTEHAIHRYWCSCCKKQVEPRVPDALPKCTLGNRTVAMSAWLHFGIGTTTSQIVEVFNRILKFPISDGGLTQMWHRLADVLDPWYQQIQTQCLNSGVLHADETGWRVNGQTWWLWCFCTSNAAYYLIDESRGHPALDQFFVEEFRGILVTDFWKAYDAIGRTKQKCWPHLLRELKEIDEKSKDDVEWAAFAKRLRRIYGDAIRLEADRDQLPTETFTWRLSLLHCRMSELSTATWTNADARRLAKRLQNYGGELLTFVEFEGVPSSNNHAERTIRPAVQMRKASYGNQSVQGAKTRSVLMSIYRTLKLRGLDPLECTIEALRSLASTGTLPPLPESSEKNKS